MKGPDPFWDRYCETRDAQQLGRSSASTVRAFVSPTVVAALDPRRSSDAVLDGLFARYAARIATSPQRNQHYPSIVVVRKTEPQ